MSKAQFSRVEQAILEQLKDGGRHEFGRLLALKFDFREIDRGLQRLRKAGQIVYRKKADGGPGWFILGTED